MKTELMVLSVSLLLVMFPFANAAILDTTTNARFGDEEPIQEDIGVVVAGVIIIVLGVLIGFVANSCINNACALRPGGVPSINCLNQCMDGGGSQQDCMDSCGM